MHRNARQNVKKYLARQNTPFRFGHRQASREVHANVEKTSPGELSHVWDSSAAFSPKLEQRVNIKFYNKFKKTAAKAHEMLGQANREEAVSKKCAYEWFKSFRDGRER